MSLVVVFASNAALTLAHAALGADWGSLLQRQQHRQCRQRQRRQFGQHRPPKVTTHAAPASPQYKLPSSSPIHPTHFRTFTVSSTSHSLTHQGQHQQWHNLRQPPSCPLFHWCPPTPSFSRHHPHLGRPPACRRHRHHSPRHCPRL